MALQKKKLKVGTVYQQVEKGNFYFRYQVDGRRKAVSLETKNLKEAIDKAEEMGNVVSASSIDIVSAHVKHAKGFDKKFNSIPLSEAWSFYEKHPERATPATVSEQNSYHATFREFVEFVNIADIQLNEISFKHAEGYATLLRTQELAVNTHNRKMRHLSKIFETLSLYRNEENPFKKTVLKRKDREEQENELRRLAFTREQESDLRRVLDDDKLKVMNKSELKVIFYLGMYTGQRFKDCVLLRWDKVDLNRRRIWVKQFKTGKEVTIPIAPQLLTILENARQWQKNQYVCPLSAERYKQKDNRGKNVGNNLINIDALRVIKWIGLEPSVKMDGRKKKVTIYGFHSLRHSFASHCAEAGVPKAVVVSILGANSDIVDKYYTHIGEEAQEKAILAISNTQTISPQDKINEALAYIGSINNLTPELSNILRILS